MHELDPQHGVGSSGTAKTPHCSANIIHHIHARLFTSPPSTDSSRDIEIGSTTLVGTHEYNPSKEVTQPGSRGGDTRGDPIDDTMGSFPRSSHVINMGTIPCTFLVNEEAFPINTPRTPGIF